MIKNWGVIGGIAAAIAAGVYVLWGPITDRKKRKRGEYQSDNLIGRQHEEQWVKRSNLLLLSQVWSPVF